MWLQLGESAFLPGYTWVGRNRTSLDDRALRGTGGVRVSIRENLVEQGFEIVIEDDHLIGEGLFLGICYITPELEFCEDTAPTLHSNITMQLRSHTAIRPPERLTYWRKDVS